MPTPVTILDEEELGTPVSKTEQSLQIIDNEEAMGIATVSTLDPKTFDKPGFIETLSRGFYEGAGPSLLDSVATLTELSGRPEDEVRRKYAIEGKSGAMILAEKIRNASLALRKMVKDEEFRARRTGSFGENVTYGVGGAGASILQMLMGSKLAGVPGVALTSFSQEKANYAQELMDYGYSSRMVNFLSTLEAAPIAALDTASFNILGSLFKEPIKIGIENVLAKRVTAMALGAAEGFVSEGTTEALQNRIQTEFEIATKIKDRDAFKDLEEDMLALVIGGMVGSSAGMVGQLQIRREGIKRLQELTGAPRDSLAQMYDEMVYKSKDLVWDEIIEQADISSDMRGIEAAFEKIAGRETVTQPEPIEETTPETYKAYEEILSGKDVATVVKEREDISSEALSTVQTKVNELNSIKRRGGEDTSAAQIEMDKAIHEAVKVENDAESLRQTKAKLEGKEYLSPWQVRKQARSHLGSILTAYKTGKRVSVTDLKGIQKSMMLLVKDSKLSRDSISRLLRPVLSVRTVEQFNDKIGPIVDNINTLINTEQVRSFQNIGTKIIERMQARRGKVTPEAQLFAQHLQNVMQGKPVIYDIENAPLDKMVEAQVEQAVYDLFNAESDVRSATGALTVLKNYYENKLEKHKTDLARQKATYERIRNNVRTVLLENVTLDSRIEATDNPRQQDKTKAGKGRGYREFSPSILQLGFDSILNFLDRKSGTKGKEGPLFREFDPYGVYKSSIVARDEARTRIDGKLFEIYGDRAAEVWAEHRAEDFIKIKWADGQETSTTKASAMSLYLMTKMPQVYNQLVDQGYDPVWLSDFSNGENVNFTEADYKWMKNVRETLDWYADQITPIYEGLTHRPFRMVDSYFMTSRYFAEDNVPNSEAEKQSILDAMINGRFDRLNPSQSPYFKQRTKGDQLFVLPDIYEALVNYAREMNHFIAYAGHVVKLREVFFDKSIQEAMNKKLPEAYRTIILRHISDLSHGGTFRDDERQASRGINRLLTRYARNQVRTPRNFFRQIASVAAAMDIEGCGPIELAKTIADLPRAVKSGDLKRLTDTAYMQDRFLGSWEMVNMYVKENLQRGKPVSTTSQKIEDFLSVCPRYGDRFASIAVGWMVYRTSTAKGFSDVESIDRAIDAIEATQQSQDPARLPMIFRAPGFWNRLLTFYNRTPAIYLNNYLSKISDFQNGRMSKKDFARTIATYHFWVPVFETLVTAGSFKLGETLIMATVGPWSGQLILSKGMQSFVAWVIKAMFPEEDVPTYLKDPSTGTLLDTFYRDGSKLTKNFLDLLEYPDYETMWTTVEAAGQVADVSPLPMGWMMQTPRATAELLSMDPDMMIKGAKRMVGYPESRLKD